MNPHIAYLAAVAWANGGALSSADLRSANLGSADLRRSDLGGANLRGAKLRGAKLRGADLGGANLRGANLVGANLVGANLGSANLVGANLGGANLRGADLGGANLSGANLVGAEYGNDTLADRIAAAERMDGYTFILFRLADGAHKIGAGCRWLTIPEYRAHVAAEYPGTDQARETLDILDYFEKRIEAQNV